MAANQSRELQSQLYHFSSFAFLATPREIRFIKL